MKSCFKVITVPAFFNQKQKAATITAAGMAGVHRIALLQGCVFLMFILKSWSEEPIAAALAYGLGHSGDQDLVLVLDVGGGTFDVSILSSFEGIMEVRNSKSTFDPLKAFRR